MNILPKKNWHVRTKENIARVRRDEAQAAEEAKELERRSKLAEQEARTAMLRERARAKAGNSLIGPSQSGGSLIGPSIAGNSLGNKEEGKDDSSVIGPTGHVNFFQQIEEEGAAKGNKEHEEEKKKEQEEYEKKVGYLTYLGQDTEELTGEQVWWKKLPKDRLVEKETDELKSAVRAKQKAFLDPLNDLRKYLKCDGVRLTMKKHERKLEEIETKAIDFESIKTKKKRKRSESRSRSRERKKRKKHSDDRHSHRSSNKSKHKSKKDKREHKKSHKKERRRSSSSSIDSDEEQKKINNKNLAKLRQERLDRERAERLRADKLVFGEPEVDKKDKSVPEVSQKYNSQFNPQIAKQNKLDSSQKYWLPQ